MKIPTVQIIIADGIEEMETVAPIDLLRRAGASVNVLSLDDKLTVTGKNGIKITADSLFKDHRNDSVNMVVIPGGPSHQTMLKNSDVLTWIQRHQAEGAWIASICAGPMVLKQAGILEGKSFTSHFTTAEILSERISDRPVVKDEKLITSQGAGTATAFALQLVEALFDKTKATEIQESISGIF